MGIFKRAAKIVQAGIEDRKEQHNDPHMQVQITFQEMIVQVGEVKRMVGEIAAAKVRVQHEIEQLDVRLAGYEDEAKQALQQGDEVRARERLQKRQPLKEKRVALKEHEQTLQQKLEHLQDAVEELSEHVRAFRDARDEAQTRLASAQGALAVQKALAMAQDAKENVLTKAQDEARLAEARVELTESIDQEFERLLRETKDGE